MSTTFRFIDHTDRTARPKWDRVILQSDLKKIANHNASHFKDPKIAEAVSCIQTLYARGDSYWIGAADDFTTATKVRDESVPIEEHEIRNTWINIEPVLKSMKELLGYARKHDFRHGFNDLSVKRAKRLMQKLDNGLIRIENVSAVNEFARAEAYALFVAYDSTYLKRTMEGYLGHGGTTLVPLQRARMFDSETAVKKFLSGHYFLRHYPKIQVVKIQMNMVGLTTVYEGTAGSTLDRLSESRIQHAAAFVQKENLEQALQDASKERLLERVREMDVEQNEADAPKRRM